MDDNSVEKNIIKEGSKIVKHLNLFTILHAFWVIEMYYLGVNTLYNVMIYFNQDYINKIPNIVLEYNQTILSYFEEYNEFVYLFAVAIFLCGIANAFIKVMPVLSKFNIVYMYADYGLSCGFWLFIIYSTYKMYLAFYIGFIFSPMLIYLAVELLKKLDAYIESKVGISFFGRDSGLY